MWQQLNLNIVNSLSKSRMNNLQSLDYMVWEMSTGGRKKKKELRDQSPPPVEAPVLCLPSFLYSSGPLLDRGCVIHQCDFWWVIYSTKNQNRCTKSSVGLEPVLYLNWKNLDHSSPKSGLNMLALPTPILSLHHCPILCGTLRSNGVFVRTMDISLI